MSVIIRGMQMQKKCIRCPVNVYGRCLVNDDKDVSKATADAVRDKDCPLVPVPSHGRLIDADVLWAEISKICDRYDAGIITDLTCLQQILSVLRHAPTVIEAEEVEE